LIANEAKVITNKDSQDSVKQYKYISIIILQCQQYFNILTVLDVKLISMREF
jgi:hypothetical protein